ncbi:unnamed protein product [Peniophora sp. CBMAI 1063]|nr:unnamed protein product [Peniophora sp. CBMAI 1063]
MATRSTRNPAPTRASTRTTRATAASRSADPSPTQTPTPAPAATRATRATGTTRSTATTKAPAATTTKAPAATAKTAAKAPAKKAAAKKAAAVAPVAFADAGDREPIKAYLRIRPHLGDAPSTATPYLHTLSPTSVLMTDPTAPQTESTYTFTHVFPPSTPQASFFTRTTLPLVQGLLQGENGLLFAYGVTNSGKTYSVQGGSARGSEGILPRTLDVVFGSVEGLQGEDKYVPVRLQAVEPAPPTTSRIFSRGPSLAPPSIASLLSPFPSLSPNASSSQSTQQDDDEDISSDTTILPVDKNHSYSVYMSYAEVYNEKIYDLLDDAGASPSQASTGGGGGAGMDQRLLLMRKALALKPSPASDGEGSGKYVAGLRQVRVRSASEAKELLRLGQLHRRVFGTLANAQSSRSHGIVTIRLLRRHRGEPDVRLLPLFPYTPPHPSLSLALPLFSPHRIPSHPIPSLSPKSSKLTRDYDAQEPSSYLTSRLTLIDLAGSERTKHTLATGDRLREAGSINKSLMVLGQCMEVLRANQRRLGAALGASVAHGEAGDTRDVRRNMAVVPFRHSKLTELLADYFMADGGGRAVMIVNVNPYDTGYDENAHVMRFSALAREVATPGVAQLPFPRLGRESPTKQSLGISGIPRPQTAVQQTRRSVVLPPSKPKGRATEVTVVEEDAEEDEHAADEEPLDPLVEALFDEIERMRLQLIEAHDRAALIEASTRAEVMRETQGLIADMEASFARRLRREVEQHEQKTDAKIDLLVRGSPVKRSAVRVPSSDTEEEDSEDGDEEQEEIDIDASLDLNSDDDDEEYEEEDEGSRETSPSPLASRSRAGPRPSQIRVPDKQGVRHHALPDDESAAASDDETETATEDSASRRDSDTEEEEEDEGVDDDYAEEDDGEYGEEGEEDEEEDERMQDKTPRKPRTSPALNRYKPSSARGQPHLSQPPTPDFALRLGSGSGTLALNDGAKSNAKAKGEGKAKGKAKALGRMGSEDSELREAVAASKNKSKSKSGSGSGAKGGGKGKGKMSALADELDGLSIADASSRQNEGIEAEEWDGEEDSMIVPVKPKGGAKKKKLLGSKAVVTEEDIARDAMEVDAPAGRVKRLTRASAPRRS